MTSSSLPKVTSVPSMMTENNTMTEKPLDTIKEKLMMSCDDPEKGKPMSCEDPEQEEPCQDSGSSYKPSE